MNRSRITGDLVSQNNIFVNTANDRVGIGSTIPTNKLDVRGIIESRSATNFHEGLWTGETTKIQLQAGYLHIQGGSNGTAFRTLAGGNCFQFTSSGHLNPSLDSTFDIGTNTVRVRNIYADTLYGDGSNLTGIVNGNIASNAAIAGTKISPNFGTQVIQTKASAVDTDMFKIIRQDHSTNALFRIFQDSTYGGGTGGCHINSNNRPLIITAKSANNTTSTSGLVLMSTGELGIGENDPDAKLHVKNGNILIESTDAGSSVGPTLDLFRNSATPADSDDIGRVLFRGEDSAGGTNTYAAIVAQIVDATNNTEDGSLEFSLRKAGSTVQIAQLTNTSFNLLNGTGLDVDSDLTIGGELNIIGSSDSNKYIDARIGSSNTLVFRSASGGGGNLVTMLQLGVGGSSLVGNFSLGDSSDSSSAAGPEFTLNRNSSSPANADYLGQIKFAGRSSTGVQRNYAKITGKILDVTNGAEDGILEFSHIKAGSQVITGRFRSDSLQLLNGTNLSVNGTTTFEDDVTFNVTSGNGILLDKSANQLLINSGTHIRFQIAPEVNTDDGKIGPNLFASGLNIVGSQTGSGLGRQIRLFGDLLTGNIKPTTDSSFSIGTSSNRFANIYADTLYGDGSNLTGIASDKIFEGNTEVETVDTGSNGIIKFTTEGSERLRILSDGKVLIGHTSNIFSYKLAVFGTDGGNSGISASRFSNNTSPASLLLSKSRSATIGNYAVLQDDDEVGMIDFRGADGTDNMSKVAEIKASVDGTPGSNDMPGRLTFHTTADGASTTTERLRIHSNGNISIQTNDVGFSGAGTLRINSGSTAGVLNLDGGATNHGGEINLFGGSNGGRILFRTGQGSGQQGEKMRLDENGSLRVGNNSSFTAHTAADNLVVGDNSGSNGMTILTNASTGNIFFNDGSGNDGVVQYVHSSSPNYMRIASSGHVRFDVAAISISDDNITPTAGDLATGASFGTPRLHMRGNNSQSGAYELMARFQSGQDANDSGATIVLNHSNDRGLALQGGRAQSNRSFGAIKAIDNLGRLSNCIDFTGGNGAGVNHLSFYTGESATTSQRLRIDSGGGVIISNAGTFPTSTSETLHVQGEGHNGHGTSNTRSVFNVVAARSSNTGAMGIWVGARTNENTAVIGTRTSNGNLAIETYNSGWGERLRIRSDGKALFYGTLGAGNLPLGGNPAPAAIQIRCNSKFNGIAFGENAVSGCIGMGGDDTSTAMVFTANAHPANLGGGVHDTFEWRSGTSGGGGPGKYMTLDTQGDLTLETGSLKVSNGEGVDFSSTGNGSGSMTNELLDDYEEGTWTPTAAQGASGITVYASRYTKVGNKVFIDFRGLLTGTNGSSVRIGGLPYPNMNSSAHNIGPIMHNGFDFAGSTEPVAVSYITGTNSYFQLYYSRTNSNGWVAVTGNDTNGQQFITSLTYFTS